MATSFESFVGVGLGIDVHNEDPDWRRILAEGLEVDFLEVYTRGDVDQAREVRLAAQDLPLLYHDDALDPILPGDYEQDAVAAAAANIAEVGAPWCVCELATRRLGGRYLDFFMPMLLTEEAAGVAASKLRRLGELLPSYIVAENPPYQLPVGPLHILDAMAQVIEQAELSCVLDLGHLYSFQLCRGGSPLDGLDGFPLERVIELHVAGAVIDESGGAPVYQDAHGSAEIPPPVLAMLAELAPRCPQLKAVTIEVEDAPWERVLRQLGETREAVRGLLEARGG